MKYIDDFEIQWVATIDHAENTPDLDLVISASGRERYNELKEKLADSAYTEKYAAALKNAAKAAKA